MGLRFTILGCGSSGGVPRIGNRWGACDPDEPRNRRRRCSLLVQRINERGELTTVLIDTSPDMRMQLLDADVGWLDAVVFTHEHADHIHGIDDLRVVALNGGARVQTWADERTAARLRAGFGYCFEQAPGSDYPSICDLNIIEPTKSVRINGAGGPIELQPFEQIHGSIRSLGFRIGGLAYSSDLNDLPNESLSALDDLDVGIVDALRHTTHPSHLSLNETLAWIEKVNPRLSYLTNMHIDLDYATLRDTLPANVKPAHDGLVIELVD